jgi:hypothetical protein
LVDGHEDDVARIAEYVKTRPDFIVIEPISHIRIFTDRMVLQDFFSHHPLPDFVEFNAGIIYAPGVSIPFPFPILLKSCVACGLPSSHFIQVVHTQTQLAELSPPDFKVIAYPFVPHYGIVFKVYSLAKEIVMRAASSIVLNKSDPMSFDSQKPLPDDLQNKSFVEGAAAAHAPSIAELNLLSKNLRKSTGVQLLGFDLLRRESDGKLVLVDFNYFPCFRNIDDIPGKFADFILQRRTSLEKSRCK